MFIQKYGVVLTVPDASVLGTYSPRHIAVTIGLLGKWSEKNNICVCQFILLRIDYKRDTNEGHLGKNAFQSLYE
jgi:hypothetical protein